MTMLLGTGNGAGAKHHAVLALNYQIPDGWRGRLFWRGLAALLWLTGAKARQ